MKKIFILNGSGGSGKDTFANFIGELTPVKHLSIITPVKELATKYGFWKGEKDERGRKFLSDIKDVIDGYSNALLFTLLKQVNLYADDYVILIDARDANDIERIVKECGAKTILITRSSIEQITSNHADANVSNYKYDYIINNEGTLENFKKICYNFYRNEIKDKGEF